MGVKILLVGPVRGNIEALAKRVKSANEKAGPFAAVLSVGAFFEPGDASAPCPGWVKACITGATELQVPVYFVGGDGLGAEDALLKLSETTDGKLNYLGPHKVAKVAGGLRIAVFDDLRAPNSAQALHAEVAAAEGDIDLLLTASWPEGVLTGCAALTGAPEGSAVVAEVAQRCRPRYHIAACDDTFHQRVPYMNRDLGTGSHATRFISLGAVGNATKVKWAHALQLEPASAMGQDELTLRPADATASPYVLRSSAQKRPAAAQDWRWGEQVARQSQKAAVAIDPSKSVFVRNLPFSAEVEDLQAYFSKVGSVADVRWKTQSDGKKQGWAHIQFNSEDDAEAALKLSGQALMGRDIEVHPATASEPNSKQLNLGAPVADCWFCLSNANADVHLVADVSEHVYVAIDKGPITEKHVLLIAVEHYPNMAMLKPEAFADAMRAINTLRAAFASTDMQLVGFERYLAFHSRGGNHCHLNFIAVSKAAAAKAKQTMVSASQQKGFMLEELSGGSSAERQDALKQAVGSSQYFQAFLPDGTCMVHAIPKDEHHPLDFGRQVLAQLAGKPAHADWKQCKMASGAAEEQAAQAFQKFYEPFRDTPLQA